MLGGGPKGPHEIEGIGASFIPKTFDGTLADEIIAVSDHDGFDMVKKLAAQEGVLAGSSGGANVFVSIEIARRLGPGSEWRRLFPIRRSDISPRTSFISTDSSAAHGRRHFLENES